MVHGDKELIEKLGRNDLCPCGSGRRFQELLPEQQTIRRFAARPLLLENEIDQVFVAERRLNVARFFKAGFGDNLIASSRSDD